MKTMARESPAGYTRPSLSPLRPISTPGHIQRCGGAQCPPGTCNHDKSEKVHRSGDATPSPAAIPPSVAKVLRTPGQALDASTRAGMEERFGHDFGQVRVHTDAEAAQSAHEIHAQAYTLGRHIVMGQGRYQPHIASGMRLLAHELVHTLQQPADPVDGSWTISSPSDDAEKEAEQLAADPVDDDATRQQPARPINSAIVGIGRQLVNPPMPTPGKVASTTARPAMAAAGADGASQAAIEQALTNGKPKARAQLQKVLAFNGLSLEQWYRGISFNATFLDVPITPSGGVVSGVHKELEERLKLAEASLVRVFPGLSKAQIARQMGIDQIKGVRIPKEATGRSRISYHSFGLAIDINHPTNPFVGNQGPTLKTDPTGLDRSPRIIERAMLLLRHQAFDIERPINVPKGPGSEAGRLWEIHQRASQTLAEYLSLANDLDDIKLQDLVDRLPASAEHRDLVYWKKRIADDRNLIKGGDFQHHKSPEKGGYMDLGKELVEALVGAGLLWGGAYSGAKDIMHFDWRGGSLKRPN